LEKETYSEYGSGSGYQKMKQTTKKISQHFNDFLVILFMTAQHHTVPVRVGNI
jgi:hypothetical protein